MQYLKVRFNIVFFLKSNLNVNNKCAKIISNILYIQGVTELKGIVINYDLKKGFGFIKSKECDEGVFFHINDVKNADAVDIGQSVEFKHRNSFKGPKAVSITAGKKHLSPSILFLSISLFIIAVIGYALFYVFNLSYLLTYLIAVNITTFGMYGYDKSISDKDKLRVPEIVLHLLALGGGSPTAILSQKFFRHKTIKRAFQLTFWVIVALQFIASLVWFYYI